MGYKVDYLVTVDNVIRAPIIRKDDEGTTSWRDAKKALRAWYLDQAKALRSVSEKDYFNTGSEA